MKLLKQHKFLLVLVILVTILILKIKFKTKIEHLSVSDLVNQVKDKVMSGINSTM